MVSEKDGLLKERHAGIERAIQALQPKPDEILVSEALLVEEVARPIEIIKVRGQLNALEHLYAAKKGLHPKGFLPGDVNK